MFEKITRRRFMITGSAAVAAPLLMKLTGTVIPEVHGAEKQDKKKKYFINDNCIGCHYCFYSCPQSAIHWGDDKYEIDQDKCIGCGTCASVCNISAPNQKE